MARAFAGTGLFCPPQYSHALLTYYRVLKYQQITFRDDSFS